MQVATSGGAFTTTIQQFVTDLDRLGVDATSDVYELCRATIDVDGMLTDDELHIFIETFAPDNATLSGVTPAELRRRRFFHRARTFLHQPSDLFRQLVESDRLDGGRRAATYLARSVDLMQSIASLDSHVSHVELAAIDNFRTCMTTCLTQAGLDPNLAPEGQASDRRDELTDLVLQLDALIGLEPVKQRVRQLGDLLTIMTLRRERGLTVPPMTHHLAFVGNPGTGKTTVARILGKIYRALGLLEKGHLVEVDRADLVAGYVGQTAAKVDEVMASAMDGVLLIDEAYGLVRGTDEYGAEAIDALVKRMEDHRDRVVIILTGYPEEMNGLLRSNPGLRSRIAKVVEFPDYSNIELVEIFERIATESGYGPGPALDSALRWFEGAPRGREFGNGRAARQLFEDMMVEHASRVAQIEHPSDRQLTDLTGEDLPR